jgi:drug/metabolite transporter (DMT)-like permease
MDRPTHPDIAALPPARHLAMLAVGTIAVGTSGPIIAATAAPALAIAFWRNAFGAVAVGLPALARRRSRLELRRLPGREWRFAGLAGLLLALHFGTWIPSLDYTSVASSIALVSTQPIWAALIARLGGHVVPGRVWTGIAVALAGVLLLTGVDVAVSARALAGDLLALVGAVFAAAYVTAGAVVRRHVSTATYTTICYTVCAAVLLAVCLAAGLALGGYQADDWLKLAGLTAGPQLLGHTVFNHVLKTASATFVSLAILFEVPIAAVIAALWLGQTPPIAVLPAALLLLTGIAIVVGSGTAAEARPMPIE